MPIPGRPMHVIKRHDGHNNNNNNNNTHTQMLMASKDYITTETERQESRITE